jgi:hypothetical protein
MSAARQELVRADVAACDEPAVSQLAFEAPDSVTFELRGASYSVVASERYPHGESTAYWGDESAALSGNVQSMLQQLVRGAGAGAGAGAAGSGGGGGGSDDEGSSCSSDGAGSDGAEPYPSSEDDEDEDDEEDAGHAHDMAMMDYADDRVERHAALARDLALVRRAVGRAAAAAAAAAAGMGGMGGEAAHTAGASVVAEQHGPFDVVTLRLPTRWIDNGTASAWRTDNAAPVCVALTVNRMMYLDAPSIPEVRVYQDVVVVDDGGEDDGADDEDGEEDAVEAGGASGSGGAAASCWAHTKGHAATAVVAAAAAAAEASEAKAAAAAAAATAAAAAAPAARPAGWFGLQSQLQQILRKYLRERWEAGRCTNAALLREADAADEAAAAEDAAEAAAATASAAAAVAAAAATERSGGGGGGTKRPAESAPVAERPAPPRSPPLAALRELVAIGMPSSLAAGFLRSGLSPDDAVAAWLGEGATGRSSGGGGGDSGSGGGGGFADDGDVAATATAATLVMKPSARVAPKSDGSRGGGGGGGGGGCYPLGKLGAERSGGARGGSAASEAARCGGAAMASTATMTKPLPAHMRGGAAGRGGCYPLGKLGGGLLPRHGQNGGKAGVVVDLTEGDDDGQVDGKPEGAAAAAAAKPAASSSSTVAAAAGEGAADNAGATTGGGGGGGAAAAAAAAENDHAEAERLAEAAPGFLGGVFAYMVARLRNPNGFCVICDRPPLFAGSVLLKPSVCGGELCKFSFQEMGVMADAADSIASSAEIIDLLICLAHKALASPRHATVFEPFPSVYDPARRGTAREYELALDPGARDFALAREVLGAIPPIASMLEHGHSQSELKASMDRRHALAHPLMNWLSESNRAHIVAIDPKHRLDSMGTPHQYLLVTAAPEHEARFQALKAEHGSYYAFHGSPAPNWHRILRTGLKNLSGTSMQLHGAAHGAGVYLATNVQTSMGYSQIAPTMPGPSAKRDALAAPGPPPSLARQESSENRFIQAENLQMMALCEVANVPGIKKSSYCHVVADDAAVVTRFLFVFCHAKHRPAQHDIDSTRQPLMGEINACVEGVLRQTRPGEASGACE